MEKFCKDTATRVVRLSYIVGELNKSTVLWNSDYLLNSNAKVHSQKSFSSFFCDANVPISNGHTLEPLFGTIR